MNTRHDILEANDAGNLLETIAATPYVQLESVAHTLSELHNLGEIDFLAVFQPPQLAEIPNRSIPALQRMFCETFPNVDCSAEAAETACRNIFDRAGNDEAAAGLLHRTAGRSVNAVELLLEKASRNQTPSTRYALATALLRHRRLYSEAMIDATLAALQHTDSRDIHTSNAIDLILYQWDLGADRKRVIEFLLNLFTQGDNALDLETLSDFRHQLRDQPGDVLGWYAVSLLLTGDHALCSAAESLLPFKETRDGLDIDLGPFSLKPPWILYLARKILGYCLLNKESAAALLLSCLRAVPDQNRAELEKLVLDHFLVNYLTAIDWFESAISDDDRAKQSVVRLSSRLRTYVAELERYGTCPAFRPTERERQLQGYRLADFWRDVHKRAEQGSLLSALVHKATILYGTSSIVYVHTDPDSEPHRQEVAMGAFEQFFEFPRLEAIDPVGLQYNMRLFRSEPPPS